MSPSSEADSSQETVIIFERFSRVNNPIGLSTRASVEILKQLDDYDCHSRRAYMLEGDIYIATEITLRRREPIELSPTMPLEILCALHAHGMSKLGDDPVLDDSTVSVLCLIYDVRQLYQWDRPGYSDANRLKGELLISLNKKLFRFKEIDYPMTRALHGKSGNVSCSFAPDNCPFSITLHASFKQPDWFTQSDQSNIVIPESNVADFLDLKLNLTGLFAERDHAPTITISKVSVQLLELVWTIASNQTRLTIRPLSWHLRSIMLLEKICKRKISTVYRNGKLICELPMFLFDCKLPKLGPTFFTNGLSRSYAIKVSLKLRWRNFVWNLETFMEITVAREAYQYLQRSSLPKHPTLTGYEELLHCLMSTETFTRELLSPDAICSHKFIDSFESGELTYCSHQTDTFTVDDHVIAVSTIAVSSSCDQRFISNPGFDKTLSKYSMSKFGEGPNIDVAEKVLLCEVVRASEVHGEPKSNELIGGLFLRTNSTRIRYKFPTRNPLYMRTYGYDFRISRLPFKINVRDLRLDLTFKCEYKESSAFFQARGEKVVLPGMRVSEVVNLLLILPVPFSKIGYLFPNGLSFHVKSVDVGIREHIRSTLLGAFDRFWREQKLRSVTLNKTIRWEDFESRWEDFKIRGEGAVSVVDTSPFDCELPKLGPTVFYNDLYRSYELYFVLHIKVGDSEQIERLEVSQKIKMAVSDFRYSEKRNRPRPFDAYISPKCVPSCTTD